MFYFVYNYNVHIYYTVNIGYNTDDVHSLCRKIGSYFDRARIFKEARDKHRLLSYFLSNLLADKNSIKTLKKMKLERKKSI